MTRAYWSGGYVRQTDYAKSTHDGLPLPGGKKIGELNNSELAGAVIE